MDDNPYTAPHTASEVRPNSRSRFGLGNVLFLLVGAAFVLLPVLAVTSAIRDAGTIAVADGVFLALRMLFGMFLIAHGVVRSTGTITVISCVLLIFVLGIAAAVVLV